MRMIDEFNHLILSLRNGILIHFMADIYFS